MNTTTQDDADRLDPARIGRVTASRISDVIARTKAGWGASRKNYMAELAAERLTGCAPESYSNAAMRWGIETEDHAVAAYEFMRDVDAPRAGFIVHPTIDMAGASPDRLVGHEGLLEAKCPNTSTHIDTLLTGTIPDKYIVQMQWQMACSARQWCDHVSFDPRLPASMQLWIKRIYRDDERIAQLEQDVETFLRELDDIVLRLREQYEGNQ